MTDVDTSSYPKLPTTQQNPLDTISKIQGIQRNNIAIDSDKLDLFNKHSNTVKRGLGGLLAIPEGELTFDSVNNQYKKFIDAGIMTPEQYAKEVSSMPTQAGSKSPQEYEGKVRKFLGAQLMQAEETGAMINHFAGTNTTQSDNQNVVSGTEGGVTVGPHGLGRKSFQPGSYTPLQPPMGTEFVPPATPQNPNPAPQKVIGGSPPITYPVGKTGGLPVAQPPNAAGGFQGAAPGLKTVQGQYAPGVQEAAKVTGQASGEQLARHREMVANYQQRVLPLEKGIDALEKLGTKGSGPGTETINNFKSFLLSNVPGITEEQLSSVKDFDSAKKYFTQYVNENGSTGTNDKLAAAFSGNPSTSISNAVAKDVAKTALSLAKMQVAMNQEFEKTGLPDDQYSKWQAKNFNKYDPRAFGVNLMTSETRSKLIKNMTADEKAKFKESVNAAEKLGLIK